MTFKDYVVRYRYYALTIFDGDASKEDREFAERGLMRLRLSCPNVPEFINVALLNSGKLNF